METIITSPFALLLASLLTAAGVYFAWRGMSILRAALRDTEAIDQSLRAVRGIRGMIVGAGLFSLAGGLYFETVWPFWFGLAFLVGEIVETDIVTFALRRQQAAESA